MAENQGKEKYRRISFRTKALMIILPVLVSSLLISNYLARKSFSDTLDSAGNRLMSYKAEQFVKYTDMQYGFLRQNSLEGNPVYLDAVKEAVRSYAKGMAQGDDSAVYAIDSDGKIEISTGFYRVDDDEKAALEGIVDKKAEGWVNLKFSDVKWVGFTFPYSPLGWQVFILEKESSFYSGVRETAKRQMVITAFFIIAGALVIVYFVNYLTFPIKKIVEKISSIKSISDIGREVDVIYPDEIGKLAFEFNRMSRRLEKSYTRLKTLAVKEAAASREVALRELETLKVLGRSSDYKDPETGAHIARVGHYSRMMARLYGENEESQELIFNSAPLHDIGKIGIPDAILLKPAKLTDDEFGIIKTHTTIAYNILRNSRSKYLQAGALIGLTHHEKYDGTGYPEGLAGEDIPLYGRIVAIADVFDALTTLRPYKEPWPLVKARDFMATQSGKHFDPHLLKLFLDNFESVEEIYKNNQDI